MYVCMMLLLLLLLLIGGVVSTVVSIEISSRYGRQFETGSKILSIEIEIVQKSKGMYVCCCCCCCCYYCNCYCVIIGTFIAKVVRNVRAWR